MVTMETADNALKSYYLGAVTEMLNTAANPLLAQIKQSTADVWGKDVRRVVRYGVNGGIGAGTEAGDLPSASGNNYLTFVSTLKNLYGTIEISDKAMRASANNEGAFVNLLNDEMDGLVKSASFNFGRMLFGDGTGLLAHVTYDGKNVFTADTVQALAEGMIVDISDGEGEFAVTGRRVINVDRAQKKVTLDSATIGPDVLPEECFMSLQNSAGLELTGFGAIFADDNILYGVNRTKYSWMNPYIARSVGSISESKIQKAIDYVEEVSGSRVNFIVCSWGVKRALAEYYATYKQMADTIEIKGGYKAMSFNGIPVVADRFCPAGTMYLINTDDFCLHQLCDWQWLEGEDGKVLKQVPGKPVYTATLVKYAELICNRPCGQAMLTGITEA